MSIPRIFTTLEKCNGYLDEFYVTGIYILMIDLSICDDKCSNINESLSRSLFWNFREFTHKKIIHKLDNCAHL